MTHQFTMSALPPIADINPHGCDVSFVPEADIAPVQSIKSRRGQ